MSSPHHRFARLTRPHLEASVHPLNLIILDAKLNSRLYQWLAFLPFAKPARHAYTHRHYRLARLLATVVAFHPLN